MEVIFACSAMTLLLSLRVDRALDLGQAHLEPRPIHGVIERGDVGALGNWYLKVLVYRAPYSIITVPSPG
jgi:hypothetical protein